VPLAKLANPAKMVPLVPLAALVMLALPAVQAKLAVQVVLETQVKTALQAAANTAHRLVWLQVIKRQRSPSQANQHLQLGRLFTNDKKYHFVKKNMIYLPLISTYPDVPIFCSIPNP
jgi:hypothetical protein